MFVTQVPTAVDFTGRVSSFGNHLATLGATPRGGDLMIRYPDGSLRNLTREAGFGMDGMQGDKAIAVREPTVHWSGNKAVFSMVVGAPTQRYQVRSYRWQLYEVSGLARGETATITKVANQPADYNNVSPFYGTDDRVLFTSDRPRGGEPHLYPQLDEYESAPTVTGVWSLNPSSGDLRLLNHAVSGAFSPFIDSFGRVVFIRWDHLQQDQQADADRASGGTTYGAANFADESPGAARLALKAEVFPEPRAGQSSPYGAVNPYTMNLFTPWQMNEDGTEEETLNHIGRQELQPGYLPRTFRDDPALSDYVNTSLLANRKYVRGDGGLFHMREDPRAPGVYYAIYAREFGSLTSNQIVRITGGTALDPERMVITDMSPAEANGSVPGGRFRSPLPLSDGQMVATHTPSTALSQYASAQFRLRQLALGSTGQYTAGAALTGTGIRKTVSWWDPDTLRNFDGVLWELEPVEVVARARPARAAPALEAPERSVLTEEQVDEAALKAWMRANDLALIVTRNQTSRDRADRQQPYNLQVPGGVRTVAPSGGRTYEISHFQIFQADQVRGYRFSGRRPIAQPLHDAKVRNPANPAGPAGSVKIAADGSTAAFVPARRALAWQTTDSAGHAIVRERVWVTFQPGEVRVCASCHGLNSKDQAGLGTPLNKPEALRELVRYWKTLPK